MHVVVVGCGRVGSQLAIRLDQSGHSVAVIDKERAAFGRWLPKRFTGRAVHGRGFDRDHLEQAGIKEAHALAAATGGDNSNILSARIARETYGVERVVARIYDPRRAVIYQRLGIPTVATVTWTTDQMMRRLFPDETKTDWSDPSGDLIMVERSLPDGWAGSKLSALGEAGKYRLVAFNRGGAARLAGPEIVGQEGDVLYLITRASELPALDAQFRAGPDAGRH